MQNVDRKKSCARQKLVNGNKPLACEKDLTDAIPLEDATMNSGGLRGDKGIMALGPTLLVAEKGP